MARFRLIFVLIAFATLYSAIAVSEDQDIANGGTIIGDIKDTTLLESPISGVRVVFVKADGAEFETQSDKDGHFERASLPAGRYLVNLYKSGYEDRVAKPVTVIEGGCHYVPMTMNKYGNILGRLQNFLGVDRNRSGVLRFSVYSNTKPAVQLEGIEIKIAGGGPDPLVVTGISNALGQYRSDGLPPGGYIVTIGKDDYHVVCPVPVYKDRITKAHIQLPDPNKIADASVPRPRESVELQEKNIIRGKVHEMTPFPTPLSDVEVKIQSPGNINFFKGTTNVDGEYECVNMPAGRYLIDLHKDGYVDRKGVPIIVVNNGNHIAAVVEEDMFASYAAVASGGLLELTHGMRKK